MLKGILATLQNDDQKLVIRNTDIANMVSIVAEEKGKSMRFDIEYEVFIELVKKLNRDIKQFEKSIEVKPVKLVEEEKKGGKKNDGK